MSITFKEQVLCLRMVTAATFVFASFVSYAEAPSKVPPPPPQVMKEIPNQPVTAVIGKVISVNPAAKTFKVAWATGGTDGKSVGSKEAVVRLSDQTKLTLKAKSPKKAALADIKVGQEVVVRTNAQQGDMIVASAVWIQPVTESLDLTASECRDLGGTITKSKECGGRQRCAVPTGSRCID